MVGDLMEENKRLDFETPLLSVRRFFASGATSSTAYTEESGGAAVEPGPKGASFPFYRSEMKSIPVGELGIVPFAWEQTPGRPKDCSAPNSVLTRPPDRLPAVPKPPPGRILKDRDTNGSPSSGIQEFSPSSLDESKLRAQKCSFSDTKKGKKGVEEKKPVSWHCDDDDVFSDAPDTLCRTDSLFMNCSTSSLTGRPEITQHSGSFVTAEVRDFMMGRFLSAAQAMASSSPQCAPRKPSSATREPARPAENAKNGEHRRPLPLPCLHKPNYVPHYAPELGDEDSYDDDVEEYGHAGHLVSKACGLLPRLCLTSSFALLNLSPGTKVPGRLPPSSPRTDNILNRIFRHRSLGQADEFSWEAEYKHKLGRLDLSLLEDESKLTSEPNQLTCWSDSPAAAGYSIYRRSGGGISRCRNEASQSPFHEGKGFLGVPKSDSKSSKDDGSDSCERDTENYQEITPHSGSLRGAGSMSPAVEGTIYVDSVLMLETVRSNSGSLDIVTDTKDSVHVFDKEIGEGDAVQLKDSEAVDPGSPFALEGPYHGEMGDDIGFTQDGSHYGPLPSKACDDGKNAAHPLQSLLIPPLPKPPSESWLWRTLPSVSSKNTSSHSFLGIQFQSKRQALQASATDSRYKASVKSSKPHPQVLIKPVSLQSEA